jgi:flagellar motor switch protein FliN/FliY
MASRDAELFADCDSWLAEAFHAALSRSVESMTSEQPALQWLPIPPRQAEPAVEGGWLWWEQPVTAGESSLCWIGATRTTCVAIGKYALSAAGIDDASVEDSLGTWREIMVQSLSATCQAIGKRLKKEVVCAEGKDVEARPKAGWGAEFTLSLAGGKHAVRFWWNASIRGVLQPQAAESQPSAQKGSATPGNERGITENSRTLGLLLEVELPVSVSFGRTQLELKDVLKLNSGSIVELNRSITEPVELIVNNCVIARGEVVVVEGNYGVRIKQIISKEERLRTLH